MPSLRPCPHLAAARPATSTSWVSAERAPVPQSTWPATWCWGGRCLHQPQVSQTSAFMEERQPRQGSALCPGEGCRPRSGTLTGVGGCHDQQFPAAPLLAGSPPSPETQEDAVRGNSRTRGLHSRGSPCRALPDRYPTLLTGKAQSLHPQGQGPAPQERLSAPSSWAPSHGTGPGVPGLGAVRAGRPPGSL